MKRGNLKSFVIAVLTTAATLAAAEIAARIYVNLKYDFGSFPPEILCDCSYVYGLNPDHPDVNSLGFRGHEFAASKPDGVWRIVVLGDSIAYGAEVPPELTFSAQLETMLKSEYIDVEVINAGVRGYTAYNELQFYLKKVRELDPDVVIASFVMNDAVNPRLHWLPWYGQGVEDIPEEAIPDLGYDRNHAIPKEEAMRRFGFLQMSMVFRLFNLWSLPQGYKEGPWFTHVTLEDDVSIKTLVDYDSTEWRWLRSVYDQLNAAVRKNGGTFAVLVFPLSYQLDPDYPYLPQEAFGEYCESRSIPCLDLLDSFRERRDERIFFEDRSEQGYYDVWHLTEQGHRITATEIELFLRDHRLLATQAAVESQ